MTRQLMLAITAGKSTGFLVYDDADDSHPIAAFSTPDDLGRWIADRAREVDMPRFVQDAEAIEPPPERRSWWPMIVGKR